MFGSNVCLQLITKRFSKMQRRGSFLGKQMLSFHSVKFPIAAKATLHVEIRDLRDECFK